MVHYADILSRCLEDEDKAHRDAVLDEYPAETQVIVRSQLQGIAKRLATYIIHAGTRDMKRTPEQCRALRRERLAAIREPWLRERVEAMVREHWDEKQ